MPSLSIRKKMSFSISLLIVILMAIIALVIIIPFEQQLKESISDQQLSMLTEMAEDIEDDIHGSQQALVAKTKQFTPEAIADSDLALKILVDSPVLQSVFADAIYLFSVEGDVIAEIRHLNNSAGNIADLRKHIITTVTTRSPQLSLPYFIHNSAHPAIMLTVPVFDHKERVIAVLAGSLDLSKGHFIAKLPNFKVGKTGFLYLFDSNRTLIIHPDKSRILKQIAPTGANRMIDKAINGFDGTEEMVDPDGSASITTVKHVKSLNWVLASHYPLDEAHEPVYRAKRSAYLAALAGLFLSVLTVWLIMSRLTSRLLRLTRHIKDIAGKKAEQTLVIVDSSDEVGALGTAFNEMIRELTSKKDQLEKALTLAENEKSRSEAIIAAIGDGFNLLDTDFRIIYQNQVSEELGGNHIGEHCYSAFEGNDAVCTGCPMRISFNDGAIHTMERYIGNHDRPLYVEITSSPVRDSDGAVIAGIEVVRDITDRKLAEEAARKVKRNLADAQRIAHLGSWELDHQTNVLWWSDETYRIFGVNQLDAVINEALFMEAVHPDDRHSVKNAFTASIVDEIPYNVVYRITRRSDGELRYVSEQCEHTKDSFGIIIRSQGVVQDITERKLSEEIRNRV